VTPEKENDVKKKFGTILIVGIAAALLSYFIFRGGKEVEIEGPPLPEQSRETLEQENNMIWQLRDEMMRGQGGSGSE